MVNKDRIHKELGKFLMFSLSLTKSDDELRFRREIEDQSEMIFPKLKIMKLTKIKQS